jgi:hypothetical protein
MDAHVSTEEARFADYRVDHEWGFVRGLLVPNVSLLATDWPNVGAQSILRVFDSTTGRPLVLHPCRRRSTRNYFGFPQRRISELSLTSHFHE